MSITRRCAEDAARNVSTRSARIVSLLLGGEEVEETGWE